MSHYVHPTAIVESLQIGEGTQIWAFAHAQTGCTIGRNCNIGDHSFIESGARVEDNVTIKNGNSIWEGVTLKSGVFVGPGVIFSNDLYPRSPRGGISAARYADKKNWLKETVVEMGASIGAGAVLLPGITIGTFAMVAAGAVVTQSVAPHALVRGNPARFARWVCQCGTPLPDKTVCACTACGTQYIVTYGKGGECKKL